MPNVTFDRLRLQQAYSRNDLAVLWGYGGYQALARGVVTPARHPYIILFVTRDKQAAAEQYRDYLEGDRLHWEGPTDHFAEDRLLHADATNDEIHLFYRERHHTDFTYYGQLAVELVERFTDRPSRFVFCLTGP